eukprot:Em0004g713a
MAVTTLRAGRPRSAQPEVGREQVLSYERYLRSPNSDLLKRQQSRTNAQRDCASPDVEPEGTANSKGAGAVEPLAGIDGDVPVSAAKSNASVQTENYGRAGGGRRPVTSARFRTASCPGECIVQLPQRPKTAAVVTSEHSTHAPAHSQRRWSISENGSARNPASPGSLEEGERLARSFMWSTATQRAYTEAGWEDRLATPLSPAPTGRESTPDPVTPQLNIRRYHSTPEIWQSVTPEWDFVQTRVRSHCGAVQPGVNFCSPFRQQQQLPGYCGWAPGREDTDFPSGGFSAQLLVRSLQPSGTTISRGANIPGYMGHVHWTMTSPPNSANQLTSARTHRHIPLDEEPSPFRRSSPLSKMITLVPPHNPFKRIDQ